MMNAKIAFKFYLGLAVVAAGLLVVLFRSALDQIDTAAHQVSQLQAKVDATNEKLVLSQNIAIQLRQLEFIKDVARAVLPDDKAQPELVGQILQIANRSGVSISSIRFSGRAGESAVGTVDLTQAVAVQGIPGVYALPLTIQASGSYSNVLSMIRQIEQNQRKIQTRSVNLRPLADAGTTSGRVSVDITLDVYVMP